MFWTILYLLPTIPMTELLSSRMIAFFFGTSMYVAGVTPCSSTSSGVLTACSSPSRTVQLSPACDAASDADVADTAVPPRTHADLCLLAMSVVMLPFLPTCLILKVPVFWHFCQDVI